MITKNYLDRLFKKYTVENNKETKKSINPIFLKILKYGLNIFITFTITVFAGYFIFELQKIDLIRNKKIESFEHIVNSFNKIAQTKFNDNSLASLHFMYNSIIVATENNYESMTDKKLIDLKLVKLKLDYLQSTKQQDTSIEIIKTSIQHHANLLKIYYGYSINDTILPIAKMIALIENNQKMKKVIDNKFIKIVDEMKPILIRKKEVNTIEEAQALDDYFKLKLADVITKNQKQIKLLNELYNLFKEESDNFSDITYKTFTQELNTPLFKYLIQNEKNSTFSYIYSGNRKELHYNIKRDKNNKFIFQEVK